MDIRDVIGNLPYRMALAGGWIDQPFVSRHNLTPPGSMVVVALEPDFRFMDRCGMGTSTRKAAEQLWGPVIPAGEPAELVKALYSAENAGRLEPSGSQDMAGLIYPGVSRLDYDCQHEGGYFPVRVESNIKADVARWLEQVIHILPIGPRPAGYSPLGIKNLDSAWIRRLGQSGRDCYQAIICRDLEGLGASMNECMRCWEAILPQTVWHPSLTIDLPAILRAYQEHHPGAMYSGCGGGYLFVASDRPVAGTLHARVRIPEARS